MRSTFVFVAALALGACATVPAAPIRTDGLAHLGEATRVGSLLVTPRALIEDSRCPINAVCVWAGRAVVQTLVIGPGWSETRNLTLGQRVSTHGLSLTLKTIQPGKMAGAPPDPRHPMLFGFEGGR